MVKDFLVGLLILASGCGTLIGTSGPVDEKSDSYDVADLSKEGSEWVRIDQKKDGTPSTAVSDVSYQSKVNSSVIFINSACRPSSKPFGKSVEEDLRSLTNPLFMGASEVTARVEKDVVVQGAPALQTTFSGRIGGERVMIRAVVFRLKTCVYQLVYTARPQTFEAREKTFGHFVSSFRGT